MSDKFIIHLIGLIRDSVHRFLIQELKKHELSGVSPSHGDLLGALCIRDGMRMQELATFINRDKSTITALVNKLIDLGYVEKERDITDNRIWMVRLTDKGRIIKPSIMEISEKMRSKAYDGLSEEEIKIVSLLLSKIYKNFTR